MVPGPRGVETAAGYQSGRWLATRQSWLLGKDVQMKGSLVISNTAGMDAHPYRGAPGVIWLLWKFSRRGFHDDTIPS
eukprot:1190439-Prorocentrum_minimum.AAC.6